MIPSQKIVVSRDVAFVEGNRWKWEASYEKEQLMDIGWEGNSSNTHDKEDETVVEREGAKHTEIEQARTRSIDETEIHGRENRARQPSSLMRDYVQGGELSKEEEINMAYMISSDPVNFEDAAKCSKWSLAMDAEIDAIERNGT